MTEARQSAEQFVCDNSAPAAPPLVPEIRLYQGGEVVPLWRKTEEFQGIKNAPPPYWAFAWAGGQALARYVLDHPETVRGKTVLDFGAGSGLVGIAAGKSGATAITAADIDPLAAAAMTLNAKANDAALTITQEDVIGQSGWQIILLGDMCYERPLAERLLAWLKRETAAGVTVLLGDPGRNYFPQGGVMRLAEYRVATSRELEDREERLAGVYRLSD
jgi:predicted nicotinamide N-methyase